VLLLLHTAFIGCEGSESAPALQGDWAGIRYLRYLIPQAAPLLTLLTLLTPAWGHALFPLPSLHTKPGVVLFWFCFCFSLCTDLTFPRVDEDFHHRCLLAVAFGVVQEGRDGVGVCRMGAQSGGNERACGFTAVFGVTGLFVRVHFAMVS
jgi:hypothetical protein